MSSPMMMSPAPSNIPPGTPPGLAYLLPTNFIVIRKSSQWSVFAGITVNKQWDIVDCWGQRIYLAAGFVRTGLMKITLFDSFGQPVLLAQCKTGCCPASASTIPVTTSQGELLGAVTQFREMFSISLSWSIKDQMGVVILIIGEHCCSPTEFPLRDKTGARVGVLRRSGYAYKIDFPEGLDVAAKATLICAAFIIDAMLEERRRADEGAV